MKDNNPDDTLLIEIDQEEILAGMTVQDLKQKIAYLDTINSSFELMFDRETMHNNQSIASM
jgi:hypothetical protein